MDYQAIRIRTAKFTRKHPSYFWSVLEAAMVFAAVYSIFGLITMVTGAMATGNSIVMILEFMAAPVYSVLLFVVTTLALCAVFILPYVLLSERRPKRRKAATKRSQRRPAPKTS